MIFFLIIFLLMFPLDWNTLIVGKLSPWIDTDSEMETERRNSEAVSFINFLDFFFLLLFIWMLVKSLALVT